ncbi:MAG: hypothetical protein SNJ57_08725 [Cyanobacteriota bacterium]
MAVLPSAIALNNVRQYAECPRDCDITRAFGGLGMGCVSLAERGGGVVGAVCWAQFV